MSKLNDVFQVIKQLCCKQVRLAEISNFGSLANKAGIMQRRLYVYLDQLQDMGLIRYSDADRYIYLTEKGRGKEQINDSEIDRRDAAML